MDKWLLGIDIGGTQIRTALINFKGDLEARNAMRTPAEEGPDAVIRSILQMADSALESTAGKVIGIGLGVPGPVDPVTGTIYNPPNLPGWGTRSILEPIKDRFSIPVFVGNDANVAALGEQRFGAGKGVEDLLYVTVSTGIGGGIISGGKLLTGWRGLAAEIGHQTIIDDGPLCGCGQPGHLEALASGPAIAQMVKDEIRNGNTSQVEEAVSNIESITAADVAEAALKGDDVSIAAYEKAGEYIGIGLANLIHILEPQKILIGGGVTNAGELLFKPVRETINSRVMSAIYREIVIERASLEDDVGLFGAAAVALVGVEQ